MLTLSIAAKTFKSFSFRYSGSPVLGSCACHQDVTKQRVREPHAPLPLLVLHNLAQIGCCQS